MRAKSPLVVGFSPGFTHVIQQQVFYCRRQLPKSICVKYSVLKCTKNRDVCLSLPSGFFQMDLTIHCDILEIQGSLLSLENPALRIRVSRLHVSAWNRQTTRLWLNIQYHNFIHYESTGRWTLRLPQVLRTVVYSAVVAREQVGKSQNQTSINNRSDINRSVIKSKWPIEVRITTRASEAKS